jgi:hypothetical protein
VSIYKKFVVYRMQSIRGVMHINPWRLLALLVGEHNITFSAVSMYFSLSG